MSGTDPTGAPSEAGPNVEAAAVAQPVGVTPTLGEPAAQADFDFAAHRRAAVDAYEAIRGEYADCARAVQSVLTTVLKHDGVVPLSIDARAKEVESFGDKAATTSETDPGQPKYPNPLDDITDLAGVRVITYLLSDVENVNGLVEREFEIVEKSTKSGLMGAGDELGYQSVHYLVRFSEARCALPEYQRFQGRTTEIQVRTVLQHGWAEIEHDIQYKTSVALPESVRRRFASLAGLVEIADREFQAISDENDAIRRDAQRLIAENKLEEVEITADSLKTYLDTRYGEDRRISDWSYGWMARILRRLGLGDLSQVEHAVARYGDGDAVSRAVWGSRQGQLNRFEHALLAAFGEKYVERNPSSDEYRGHLERSLAALREAGIDTDTSELPPDPDR